MTPWLDRAPNAVPVRLATALHDERNRSSTRDACDWLLPTTLRLRAPTSRSAIWRCAPLARSSRCMARFTTPHALRMARFPFFRSGHCPPAASTELSSSDAPVTALRLPSNVCIALARWLSPAGGDSPAVAGDVCERAAKTTRLRRSVTIAASTDDPERLPSDGQSLTPRGLPPVAFRFGNAAPVSRCCARSRRRRPFVRLLPLRYDREHDPYERLVPRFLRRGRAGARSVPRRRIAAGTKWISPPGRTTGRFAVAPVLVLRPPFRGADECERASRAVDDFPRSCERLPSPARAESPESRDSSVNE